MWKIKLLFLLITLSISSMLFAFDEIDIKDGNIYYGNTVITSLGKDKLAILSLDKKKIVFVRSGTELIPEECSQLNNSDDKYADQIWFYDLENKREYLLLDSKLSCDKPEEVIIRINELKFSPDNKIIYFLTSAWNESDALHAMNINGANQHYLVPALTFEVITKGENVGYLLVKQRKYFPEEGSIDWYWLFTPDGKEVAPIGPNLPEDDQTNMTQQLK